MNAPPPPLWSAPSVVRGALLGCLLLLLPDLQAQDNGASTKGWTDKDSRLANEYLSLLVDQPEYGRVVDLLWDLYAKRDSTALLLDNLHAQALAQPHPSVLLVEAHLVRRSGDLARAATLYDAILKAAPAEPLALRSRADVAMAMGDPTGAATYLQRLIETLPAADVSRADLLISLGDLHLAASKTKEAADAWAQAAELRPADAALARSVAERTLRAGLPERAAVHLERVIARAPPAQRLEALLDLARVHEHLDQAGKAEDALKQALALLDFQHPRYGEVFQRRVRLNERFSSLDTLRNELLTATRSQPPKEKALSDMARFHGLTADPDEQIVWLRALVKQLPSSELYLVQLVRALLDHEGAAEAAGLLDTALQRSDTPSLQLLRTEADLRIGKTEPAVARLERLLQAHAQDLDLEKQVLSFARERSLDVITQRILQSRVSRDPAKPEPLYELATFYRSHDQLPKAITLLEDHARAATSPQDQARRLSDAAAFLLAAGAREDALRLQKQASALSQQDKDLLVRLAEIMVDEQDAAAEVIPQLEAALAQAHSLEAQLDIDERIYSLLVGSKAEDATKAIPNVMSSEFKLPAHITGEGFGSGAPVPEPDRGASSPAVRAYAEKLLTRARADGAADSQLLRAAWWAQRAGLGEAMYEMLRRHLIPAPSTPPAIEEQRFLLDLALADENRFFASRLLHDLQARDLPNRTQYLLRLAELAITDQQPDLAVQHLSEALREKPASESLLGALSQVYLSQGKMDKALDLWKVAISRATGAATVSLRQRYAELLLRANRLGDYIDAQIQLVEAETDVKLRREHFKRFLDRVLFSDASGGDLAENILRDRLILVEAKLQDQRRKHPFDGFFHEALAAIYERRGDSTRAFQAMRQAYYTSPDVPFSLDQLRDSALVSADQKAAIYFQKQIVSAASGAEVAAESRRLVQMLEASFNIAEADKVRRRLENRFSQDPIALEDLARYYRETGQDEAERRVYEQIQKVKPWDARSTLRLALKCLSLGDAATHRQLLTDLLQRTQARNALRTLPPERWPYPLTDERKADTSAGALADVAEVIEESRVLEKDELTRIKAYLTEPRPEFTLLPDDISLVRLRAIEELGKQTVLGDATSRKQWQQQWSTATVPEVEQIWALYYGGAGEPLHQLLLDRLSAAPSVDLQFVCAWLFVKSGGLQHAMRWAGTDERRKRMLRASLEVLASTDGFHFSMADLHALGQSSILTQNSLLSLLRSLQDSESYREAMVLGEALREKSPDLRAHYSLILAGFAQSAEDWPQQRAYLDQVLRGPLDQGGIQNITEDPFILAVTALHRLARSGVDKSQLLQRAQSQLAMAPHSALNEVRAAVLAAIFGASEHAVTALREVAMKGLVSSRTVGLPRELVMPQSYLRDEEVNHLRSYWEDLRLIGGILSQQGLGKLISEVDGQIQSRLGGVQLGPRTSDTFGYWRRTHLISRMKQSDYPSRQRLIREYLATVDLKEEDSVDTLTDLGRELEINGYLRECIQVYEGLPQRAPTNTTYAEFFLRVCEQGGEPEPGRVYVEGLFGKDPVFKPQGIGDEVLREKHARYLAMQHKAEALRKLGLRTDGFSRVLTGRIPPEVPYLRELALLLEYQGDKVGALAMWERHHLVLINGTPRASLGYRSRGRGASRPFAHRARHQGPRTRHRRRGHAAKNRPRDPPAGATPAPRPASRRAGQVGRHSDAQDPRGRTPVPAAHPDHRPAPPPAPASGRVPQLPHPGRAQRPTARGALPAKAPALAATLPGQQLGPRSGSPSAQRPLPHRCPQRRQPQPAQPVVTRPGPQGPGQHLGQTPAGRSPGRTRSPSRRPRPRLLCPASLCR